MATGLALLEEAVELFAGVDVEALSGDELHDTIRRLSVVSNRLEAQVVRVVHRWDATLAWADNGSKAPGARLARETGCPRVTRSGWCAAAGHCSRCHSPRRPMRRVS